MNKIITVLILTLSLTNSYAQHKLRATYKVKVLERSYQEGMPLSVKPYSDKMDDEVADVEYTLIADKDKSLWELNNRQGFRADHLGSAYAGTSVYYKDIAAGTYTEQHFFSDNIFLLDFSSRIRTWVISKESKEVNGSVCFKATTSLILNTKNSTIEKAITAWYCPELKYSSGPKQFGGLPGLILELTDGNLCYYVTDVNTSSKNAYLAIKTPTDGKKVTFDELLVEQEKLSEAMLLGFKK